MLNDSQINEALESGRLRIEPFNSGKEVESSSVNFTVGDIFLPDVEPDSPGSVERPKDHTKLKPGGTALVRTKERITLPDDLAATAYPPTSLSHKAVLMTNPGHIDPGYSGHLHFTLINMSKETVQLSQGTSLATLLFFPLSSSANIKSFSPPQIGRLLDDLSADFLEVEARSEKAAKTIVDRRLSFSVIVGTLAGVAIAILGNVAIGRWFEKVDTNSDEIVNLRSELRLKDQQILGLERDIEGLRNIVINTNAEKQ